MKVLFCGGHADGRWIDVPPSHDRYRVAVPGAFDWRSKEAVVTEEQEYRIWDINILGFGMRVAALATRNYENHDVIRALCQRDVADHLTGRTPR